MDYFLFDTKGKYYGGNAKTFNWKILEKYDQEVPFFLSGGLSPENVNALGDIVKHESSCTGLKQRRRDQLLD